MRRVLMLLLAVLVSVEPAASAGDGHRPRRPALHSIAIVLPLGAQGKGIKKRRPMPDEFGGVLMNNYTEKAGTTPVLFRHWSHRARFTCRLCHVDIGFGMQANTTGVHEAYNRAGSYCGTCHDGTIAFDVKQPKSCVRCHSMSTSLDFAELTQGLPRGRFGNNVDWELAEIEGKISLTDTLPGVSVQRKPLDVQKDYSIDAKISGLPQIVFSHKKHAVWNGCELCHPDIFAVKAGTTRYTMEDIFAGRYCGLCHGSVAFPAIDCQRCHVKPVTQ